MADISATHNSVKLANPITDSLGDPVTLDDNPAHVAGFLYEVSRYFQREGVHSALIRYGAVVLKNGTTAVSHLIRNSDACAPLHTLHTPHNSVLSHSPVC